MNVYNIRVGRDWDLTYQFEIWIERAWMMGHEREFVLSYLRQQLQKRIDRESVENTRREELRLGSG